MVAAKVVKISGRGDSMVQSVATQSATLASAEEELLNEALLMRQVGMHKHLVSLIGVITRGSPKIVVISFCENGELLSVLKKKARLPPRLALACAGAGLPGGSTVLGACAVPACCHMQTPDLPLSAWVDRWRAYSLVCCVSSPTPGR